MTGRYVLVTQALCASGVQADSSFPERGILELLFMSRLVAMRVDFSIVPLLTIASLLYQAQTHVVLEYPPPLSVNGT